MNLLKYNELSVTKRMIIALLAVLVLMWFLDFRPIAAITGTWTTFTSHKYSFSIDYPQKWVARQYDESGYHGTDNLIWVITGPFGESGFNMIGIMRRVAVNPSLEDVSNWGEGTLINDGAILTQRGKEGYRAIDVQTVTIKGVPILRRIYTLNDLKGEDVYIARSEDMIIIRLETSTERFENYIDDFERMVTSFEPLK